MFEVISFYPLFWKTEWATETAHGMRNEIADGEQQAAADGRAQPYREQPDLHPVADPHGERPAERHGKRASA